MPLSAGTGVKWIGKREVELKLAAAAPRILIENRAMVSEMLAMVKAEIEPTTPVGPGHFGYHLRDSYRIEVRQEGMRSSGSLKAAVQGYWREFGTRGGYRSRNARLRAFTLALARQGASFGTGGEKAGLFATHALARVRSLIRAYYGKAQWWRL